MLGDTPDVNKNGLQALPPEDEKNNVAVAFRTEKWLRSFYQDYFVFTDKKDSRREKLLNCLYEFNKSSLSKKKGYRSATVYERIMNFNQEINDFRTGKYKLSITIPDDDLQLIDGCAGAVCTSRSNLLRMFIFTTIMDAVDNGELKYDEQTMNLFNTMRSEYNTIVRQIGMILDVQ